MQQNLLKLVEEIFGIIHKEFSKLNEKVYVYKRSDYAEYLCLGKLA